MHCDMFFNGIDFYNYLAESRLNFTAEKQFSEPMSGQGGMIEKNIQLSYLSETPIYLS